MNHDQVCTSGFESLSTSRSWNTINEKRYDLRNSTLNQYLISYLTTPRDLTWRYEFSIRFFAFEYSYDIVLSSLYRHIFYARLKFHEFVIELKISQLTWIFFDSFTNITCIYVITIVLLLSNSKKYAGDFIRIFFLRLWWRNQWSSRSCRKLSLRKRWLTIIRSYRDVFQSEASTP